MKIPARTPHRLASFITGAMAASLAASIALNIQFYHGKLSSPTSTYCTGFYDGAINAIQGSAPKAVELKRR